MRVTTKGARTFFLTMLIVGAVLLIYQCFTMANAFNLSPYTFKLRSKTTAADSLYIKGDTLYCNQMAVSLHAVMQAVAVQTDTVRGSSTIVGITDDTLIVDADSTGSAVTIRFGRWGGGLRWNRTTDAMQYTNDFSTWTAIGTGGSSTTNADSLFHIPAFVRPQTDGYVLKFDADGDSLYLSEDATGAAGDSNAIIYSTDRVQPYSDTGIYIGGTSDDMMMDFTRADTILAFVGVFYGEGVADSMLMSKGWIESIVGDSVAGKIDGINSSNGISGSASEGVANIQLDPEHFAVGGSVSGDTVRVTVLNSGRIVLNSDGNPPSFDELTINENIVTIRGYLDVLNLDSWAIVHTNGSGYLDDISVGAAGTVFMGTGTSAAPAFYALKTVIDTLSGVAIPVADSTNGGAIRAETVDTSNQHIAVKANIGDSIAAHWAAWVADANVSVRDSLHKYLDTNEALYSKIDTTTAKIPTATLADTTVGGAARAEVTKTVAHPWLYAYIDTSRARIPASDTAYVLLHSFAYNYIDTSSAIIPRATLADSTNGGAIRAEAAKIAYRLTAAQGSANTFGRMVGDSIDVDSIHAGRISIGTDASITDITGDGLAIAAGALTASLGTAITSSEITDGTIALGDMGSNSVDSTKITDGGIGSGDIGTGRITTTHVLDNTLAAADIATGAVATAEILDRTVAAIDIDTSATIKANKFNGNWLTAWPDSTLSLGSGAGLTISSSITLGTDITDTIRRDIQIPEYKSVVYPRGYHATDIAAYDSTKMTIRPGHDANGSYIVCIDSLVWATDHSRYAVLGFPMPEGAVRLNRILIQASSAENAVDSGVVWAGLKKNSVDSAGAAFHLEDLADRDSTSTSALDTLVLDNTGGLVAESYTEGDVAYVVVRFTTRAGNGRSGVASYYIRKAWAEWVRNKL